MKFFNKKGQAALEFLTSYGWAILVVLVMIGALSSFGILNPDTFLPERCSIDPNFACVEYNALRNEGDDDGELNLILSNQVGQTLENVTISDVRIAGSSLSETDGWSADVDCGLVNQTSEDMATNDNDVLPFAAGSNMWLRCEDMDSSSWAPVGNKQGFEVLIDYKAQGRRLPRSLSADLYINVQ